MSDSVFVFPRSPAGGSDEGRDTIKVCVRIRPANSFESRDAPSVRCISKDDVMSDHRANLHIPH